MKYIDMAVRRKHFLLLRRGKFILASILSNTPIVLFALSTFLGAYFYSEIPGSSIDSFLHKFRWWAFLTAAFFVPINAIATYLNYKLRLTNKGIGR